MASVCNGTKHQINENLREAQQASSYFLIVNMAVLAIGTVYTSIFLCVKRKCADIPVFVII